LKRLGTVPVNLVVDQETADALNKVVEDSNMVRDAFVNRLIMFLRSSTFLLKFLELPSFVTYTAFEGSVEPMPTSPLAAIEAVCHDPLYYLRAAIENNYKTGLYLVRLPPQLVGFECYLADDDVPGTPDYEAQQLRADELLRELEDFESAAFSKPAETKK
jgi:hypothetical protein